MKVGNNKDWLKSLMKEKSKKRKERKEKIYKYTKLKTTSTRKQIKKEQ